MKDMFWTNYYAAIKNSPDSWFFSSIRLKRVADILWSVIEPSLRKIPQGQPTIEDGNNVFLLPIYQMLSGLSFELLVKAIFIKENSNKARKLNLKSHNIIQFIQSIQLNREEKELLKKLEIYVVWAGRYPIPNKIENFVPDEVRIRSGVFPGFKHADKDLIEKMYIKLSKLMKQENTVIT